MSGNEISTLAVFKKDIQDLFFQRAHICLWLGVVFFSLFALLDYVCCREQFILFFIYRLVFVILLLCFINLLRLPLIHSFAQHLINLAMLLGALAISLMTIELGGFFSGYYVGILLMIAGALSVLPMSIFQVLFIGFSMYVVYVVTVIAGTGDISSSHIVYGLNNTFFFFSIVGVTAVQSYDDMQVLLKELRAHRSIKSIRRKLGVYTGDLEDTVQLRLAELQESALKYQDLYDNILDLVVVVDSGGKIRKINKQSVSTFGKNQQELEGQKLQDLLVTEKEKTRWFEDLAEQLKKGRPVRGVQLRLINKNQENIDVELSASVVVLEDEHLYFQLILRDITAIKTMEKKLLESERLIGTSRQAAIFGLAKLAECRDDDTGAHLLRIQSYTHILCEELAKRKDLEHIITNEFIGDILNSCVLHDIGKVGIPDSILLKPESLNNDEFELMKQHCIYGSETLTNKTDDDETVSFLLLGREIARSHHERWDGRGYPDGLSGSDIPLAARIIALADVYDALTSSRVYKPAFNHEVSKEIIIKESGGQFDPKVVHAFLTREHAFKETRMQLVLQQTSISIE